MGVSDRVWGRERSHPHGCFQCPPSTAQGCRGCGPRTITQAGPRPGGRHTGLWFQNRSPTQKGKICTLSCGVNKEPLPHVSTPPAAAPLRVLVLSLPVLQRTSWLSAPLPHSPGHRRPHPRVLFVPDCASCLPPPCLGWARPAAWMFASGCPRQVAHAPSVQAGGPPPWPRLHSP